MASSIRTISLNMGNGSRMMYGPDGGLGKNAKYYVGVYQLKSMPVNRKHDTIYPLGNLNHIYFIYSNEKKIETDRTY